VFDCEGADAAMDECGECDGDGSSCADCFGVPNGDGLDDCSGDGDCFSPSWVGDGWCDGADQDWGADLTCFDCDGGDCIDECGVCDGDGIADGDCDCDGNTDDCCGDCGGDNSGCGASGDVNGGGLDVTDIIAMVADILETDALDACEAYEADMTGDGTVNVLDVIAAVEAILSGDDGGDDSGAPECALDCEGLDTLDEVCGSLETEADQMACFCDWFNALGACLDDCGDDPLIAEATENCSGGGGGCADGYWDCGDGQCIPESYVCDGSSEFCNAGWPADCANGADEGLEACGYTDDCVADDGGDGATCDGCEFDCGGDNSGCGASGDVNGGGLDVTDIGYHSNNISHIKTTTVYITTRTTTGIITTAIAAAVICISITVAIAIGNTAAITNAAFINTVSAVTVKTGQVSTPSLISTITPAVTYPARTKTVAITGAVI
jgi:hypothetical protein